MKKILFLLILLIVVFSPRIYWQLKPATTLDISVVDKTVPLDDYREHNGLFWLLTNEKITRLDGELYDIGRDYVGYDPYDNKAMEPYNIDRFVDLIYIADTYGVYADDLEEVVEGDRSKKIYGGMDLLEWNAVMASKGPDTMLIAEYNSFATPTDGTTREIMEQNLGVDWSGWSGRYFEDLNSEEIPSWLIDNYETQYNKEWAFEGAGLAFVHLNDKVVVFDEKSMNKNVMFSLTEEGKEKFQKAKPSDYAYWFDIITPLSGTTVYAKYDLDLTEDALKELRDANIPTSFPAIVRHEMNNTYYFAGDYADYSKDNLKKWQRSDAFMNIFSNDATNFFWVSYIPIMRVILEDIKQEKVQSNDKNER
ncbi:hypothetical protein [Lysinibacillus sp. 54212]|uniref:hypothetical protein n=1 Tax=Lysinibacillus sp. 54212 TaxID=3119829 RepID=UPI002FC629CE